MKAGELHIDYLGSKITRHGVGPTGRTVSFEIGSITHEMGTGISGFRTYIVSSDRINSLMLKPSDEIEIS